MKKLLIYDIETFPHKASVWEKYETNVLKFEEYGSIASISYRWYGQKKIHVISRRQFKDKTDKSVLLAFHKVSEAADSLLAHNGDAFDKKTLNAHYAKHRIDPPKPTEDLDTKKIAKKYFRFPGNSLNDLAGFFGIGKKLKHTGFDMWDECRAGEKSAWNLMERYNKHDVDLLTEVYEIMKPWIYRQPSISLSTDREGCVNGCVASMQKRGFLVKLGKKLQRLQCQGCGAWTQSSKIVA